VDTALTMDIASELLNAARLPPSGTNAAQEIVAEVHAALEAGQLDLPTLPDVALKIQDLIDDPDVSADRIVNLLSSDPVISAHIIKAANCAALSNGKPVDNLRNAISRLGYRMLPSMVLNITMTKLFQARNPFVHQQLKALWEHSREVATASYVLARQHKYLKPDQAMLAGLVHDIGALPLYLYSDRHHSRPDQATMEELVARFSASVGTKLLQGWNFPDELVDVVAGHMDMKRADKSPLADYTDVVTMANLQMQKGARFTAWNNVRSAQRLGYSPADCLNFLSDNADQLAAVRSMLQS